MKVQKIKSAPPFESVNMTSLGIISYDTGNDFPQKVEEIVRASSTGLSCLRTYQKYIYGRGFADTSLSEMAVNRRGEVFDYVLKMACNDFGLYGGFAIHINYNANYKIAEIHHIPFEHIRFEVTDEDTGIIKRVALHKDWTSRLSKNKRVKKGDVDFIDLFNPDREKIRAQVIETGGWHNYKGQVYYYSNQGALEYPTPIFEAVLTNMRSQEGLDNIVGRNICSGFMPKTLLVDVNNSPESEEQFDGFVKQMKEYVGDETATNVVFAQVKSLEDMPQKVDLQGENFDKEFTVSQEYLPSSIGKAFNQPAILRGEDIGAGFGADLIVNANKFYNSYTEGERIELKMSFEEIFKHWHTDIVINADIEPLSYIVAKTDEERLTIEEKKAILEIISNDILSGNKKANALIELFGMAPEKAFKLITQ